MPKNTITNRANHRPKGNLWHSSVRWVLKTIHGKAVQVSATIGIGVGGFIMGKGGSENLALVAGGAVTAIIAAVAKDTVVWIARRFTIDIQDLFPELDSDAFPGEMTRAAIGIPKDAPHDKKLAAIIANLNPDDYNEDGSPILRAVHVPKPQP